MRKDTALNQAFAGCGTLLGAARTSPRFNQLLQANQGDTGAAILDLLGETLITAAGNCLPLADQRQLEYWPELSAEEQYMALENLLRRLTTPPENRPSADELIQAPFLPLEMGEWGGEKPQPNCLGMMITLAAFAQRAVGSSYYVASVQRLAAEPVNAGLQDIFGRARRLIEQHLPQECSEDSLHSILGSMIEEAHKSSSLLATRSQFHGAIILRRADGKWICLDPYQYNLSIFPPERPITKVAMALSGGRSYVAPMNGNPAWTKLPQHAAELDRIEAHAHPGTLLAELQSWSKHVWTSAQHAATGSPHYALAVSHPTRSLAVRTIINLRLRDSRRRPVIAADLLPYSKMDIVLYHAMADSRKDMTPAEKAALKHLLDTYRHIRPDVLHPLLIDALKLDEKEHHAPA